MAKRSQTCIPKTRFFKLFVLLPELIVVDHKNVYLSELFGFPAFTSRMKVSPMFWFQDHYDWGLRAIKSVLVVAGSLKRRDKNRPEDQVPH